MATHDIHLELASNLSTEALIAFINCFLAHLGPRVKIYSHCGTNCIGSKGVLDDVRKSFFKTF